MPSIDWYISLSAAQGDSRVSDVADLRLLESPSRWTVAEPLHTSFMQTTIGKTSKTITRPASHRKQDQSSRLAIHMVFAGDSEAPRHGTQIQYGKYLFYCNVNLKSSFMKEALSPLQTTGLF